MKKMTPFNIALMMADNDLVSHLKPVTRTDIYDGITNNFHDEGLFSLDIFGRVGSTERDNNFSYIKLNTRILHPAVFNILKKLKKLYMDVLMGAAYAEWDDKNKDFVSSDMINGETGYSFFVKHVHELNPDKRTSRKRNRYVDIFFKVRNNCLMENHLVIPAGMRDLIVDGSGREVQDEINDFYRRLIVLANSVNLVGGEYEDQSVDQVRRAMQSTANNIYDYLKTMLEGKKGLVQTKWGGRKIVNGTRNVISMMDTTVDALDSDRASTVDNIQVGLYQTIKGMSPFIVGAVKRRFTDEVFTDPSRLTTLINPKTLELDEVDLDANVWDKFGTTAGLEKLINGFKHDNVRNKPVMVGSHYLWLVYDNGTDVKLFRDINELPNKEMRKDVHPLTYAELYYLSDTSIFDKAKILVTRYPIDSLTSIFPARLYLRTTTDARPRNELGEDWETVVGKIKEFPNKDLNAPWVNTVVIHPAYLASLGADFDGDTTSCNFVYSKNAIQEIEDKLNGISSVLNSKGDFLYSTETNISKRVFKAFTEL